jgi:fucose permease
MGAVILNNADDIIQQLTLLEGSSKEALLDQLAGRVILPYSLMVICLIALAAGIRFSSLPEAESGQQQPDGQIAEALRHPQLLLGVVALFLYVGAEVIAADTIGLFGQSEHIPLDEARNFAALTLGAMVAGYFAGIALIPKVISQARALSISAIAGVVLTLLAVNLNGFSAVLCIALLGLANALMWPAIWPLALSGIGRNIPVGSALLIMAIAGGAVLPLLYGLAADNAEIGRQQAYLILLPCYLFIFFYAVRGHKLRKDSPSNQS